MKSQGKQISIKEKHPKEVKAVAFSDEEIATIVESRDKRKKTYFPLEDNEKYSIKKRSENAGFDVDCGENENIKVFVRKGFKLKERRMTRFFLRIFLIKKR